MGDLRINLRSVVTIGLLAFASVWVVNRGLSYAGMTNWQA